MKLTDITKCKECGSTELSWHTHKKVHNDIPQGRLNSADISMLFVLGCDECSETLAVINSSKVAELLNEEFAAAPLPQVQSEALDLTDVLSAMLWLYHRLPRAYGRVSVIEAPISNVAKVVGMTVAGEFAQRAADQQPVTPCGALADNDVGVAK